MHAFLGNPKHPEGTTRSVPGEPAARPTPTNFYREGKNAKGFAWLGNKDTTQKLESLCKNTQSL